MIVSVTIADSREGEIEGAIRSVVDRVDRVLLVDTGARDRTLARARSVAGDKLTVESHEWVDFSTARNASLDAAEKLIAAERGKKRSGCESGGWIVVVDSDERLDFGALDLRAELGRAKADVLLVESDDGVYPKEKIVRAGCGARYVGPTHEALVGGARATLRGATFEELPKTDEQFQRKVERDVAVLTDYLKDHADDARWHYYLGLSYEGLGDRARAAEAYGECARLRAVGCEAAWASFRQAEQFFHLERYEESVSVAARGLGADPTVAECAWIAAESALKLGRREQAVAWARMAESVGRFRGCAPERAWLRFPPALYELPYDVLRSALPDEGGRALAAMDYDAAKIARVRALGGVGDRDLDWVSVSRSVPASARDDARSMLRPPKIGDFCPSARATKIQFDPPGGRLPMNPSVCRHRGAIWCVVRAVNYSMRGREYTVHDPLGVVRSENYLGRLDRDGRLVEPRLMRDLDPSPRYPSTIVGYEDVRLVSVKGRGGDVLAASATVCDRDPEGRRLIARLHLTPRGDVRRADVQPSNQLHEKNWMPLAVGGKLAWIYSLDPTAVLPGPLRDCPFKLDHLRGGAAIEFGKGYLCIAHEVVDEPDGRIYLHRFVQLDEKWRVTSVSPAWVFAHRGIEFCAGMMRDKEKLVLSYGINDREAWIVRVDVKEVEAMRWITP